MTIDARSLMIPQPEGSSVYFRPLTKVIQFAMEDALGWGWEEPLRMTAQTFWAPHMPLARRPVHPE